MTDQTPAAAAPALDNTLLFPIPGTGEPGVSMSIDCGLIPPNIRLDFLKSKVRDYVQNSVNQANVRHTKALEPWTRYDTANAADPTQTAVPKPEGERPVLDLTPVATAARDRLYKGEVRKQGERKETKRVDPVEKAITDAVVRELFEKEQEADKSFKYPTAIKAVSDAGGGTAYLNAKIEALVAGGADRAALEKYRDEKYVNPAKMMYGQRDTKATKDLSLL